MHAITLKRLFQGMIAAAAAPAFLGAASCSQGNANAGAASNAGGTDTATGDDGAMLVWPQDAVCVEYPDSIPDGAPFYDGPPLVYLDDDDNLDGGVEGGGGDGALATDGAAAMSDAAASVPDGGDGGPCSFYLPLPCDAPHAYVWLTYDQCQRYCGPISRGNCLIWDNGAGPELECLLCGGGRRPEGYSPRVRRAGGAVAGGANTARYLAAMADLEAASIDAFLRLARELAAHEAPRSLVVAATRAARDEQQHARMMRSLAKRRGADPLRRERRAPMRVRALQEIALENAVEGCVRETYGALLATWQASVASDPEIRRAMQRIARDETRHAALSFRLARWLEPRLGPLSQKRIEAARVSAIAELRRMAREPMDSVLAREAGLPTPDIAERLMARLTRAVWNDAAA